MTKMVIIGILMSRMIHMYVSFKAKTNYELSPTFHRRFFLGVIISLNEYLLSASRRN